MGQVTVKSKFGQLGTMDQADFQNAQSHGFTLASDEEVNSHNNKEEYGSGVANPAIAFAEEAAGTASFGLSRQLENMSGLTTPEAQAARAQYNPIAHLAGIGAGLVLDSFGAIGLTSKIGGKIAGGAAKVLGKAPEGASLAARALRNVPAAAAGAAAEGAMFGAGQSVTEHALGDPDLNGEKLMSNVGYGALYAGGLGSVIEGGANVFGKSTLKQSAAMKSYQADIEQGALKTNAVTAEQDAMQTASQNLNPDMNVAPFTDFPKSLDEIKSAVKTNFPVVPEGLPSSQRLKDAVDGLPDLQFKPHNLQYESLKDQGLRDYYKTFLEGQGEESKAIRDYEALQKAEATSKLDTTIADLAPESKLTTDPVKSGDNAVEAFTKQYQAEKTELAPLFKQFDKAAEGKNVGGFNSLMKLHDAFPSIGEYLNADAEGVFQLSKYKATMPFSKEAYESISDLVEAVNDGHFSLSKLRNVRESMRARVKFDGDPRAAMEVGSIRKMLMDEMQEHISKLAPDMNVREVFKRYAQNEEKRAIIEKIMGGSVSDRASFGKTIKPEDVLNKIFSNTVSVNAAKEILGKDFNKVLGEYLAGKRALMTDEAKNGFSSNKFATFLKGKGPELAEALAENPQTLKRFGDLTDYMRILPDSPSVNPSGTAKTLNIMEKIAGLSRSLKPTQAIQDFAEKYANKAAAEKQKFTIGEVLAGKHFGAAKDAAEETYTSHSKLARIERIIENTAYTITENAKAIFKTGFDATRKSIGLIGSKLAPSTLHKKDDDGASNEKHGDVFAKIKELQSDPEKMISELEKATASIDIHAPNIAQGVHIAATRATEFLATKMPPQIPKSPFSNDAYKPSNSELSTFERYLNVVENPLIALDHIKSHKIMPEMIETLSTVYPKLYEEMKHAVIKEASDFVGKKGVIPYKLRLSIGMFLGEPLDASFNPPSINANQMAFIPPPTQPQPKPSKSGSAKMTLAKRTGMMTGRNDEA